MDSSASIAVIGGSIAGCAAAIAARRAGHRVTVFERGRGELAERGFGIAIPEPLHAELVATGYLDAAMPSVPLSERLWLTRAPGGDGQREIWRQPSRLLACNWGLLWQSLRANVPDEDYRSGSPVTAVNRDAAGATVRLADDTTAHFDLVIGADGYRSVIRGLVDPAAEPGYAGYVGWRGAVPVADLSGCDPIVELLGDAYASIGFDGGHAVFYRIPDRGGGNRLNWMVYAAPPGEVDPGLSMSYAATTDWTALTEWFGRLSHRVLPTAWTRPIDQTPAAALAFQPIFDLRLDVGARTPFALVGDAGTITRPHTASGATKALQDALYLEETLRDSADVDTAVRGFGAGRTEAGNRLVELGRRLGRDQVLATPPWDRMDAATTAEWLAATMDGQGLYFMPGPEDDR